MCRPSRTWWGTWRSSRGTGPCSAVRWTWSAWCPTYSGTTRWTMVTTLAQCRHRFTHLSTSGSVRLLRTGATAGTPYSYMINKVREGEEGSGFAEVISRLFLCSYVQLLDINFLCRKYHVGLSGLDLYRNIWNLIKLFIWQKLQNFRHFKLFNHWQSLNSSYCHLIPSAWLTIERPFKIIGNSKP